MGQTAIDERDPFIILAEKESHPDCYEQGMLCIEAVIALLRVGREHADKVRTFEAHLLNPGKSQRELAVMLGVSQFTVHRHLSEVRREIGGAVNNGKLKTGESSKVLKF